MKRYLVGSTLALVVLTLAAGVGIPQLGRTQSKLHMQMAGDGTGPIPVCRPGTPCSPNDQVREMAGDGTGPIPVCRPGTPCSPNDQVREMAGDGTGPIPVCRPEIGRASCRERV
jgi:hypothetical protein